jgi:predicted DNA-binding transcriptional regulator YafY
MAGLETRGEIIRRILALIDLMAAWRNPQETNLIVRSLNEKLSANYHRRTVYRDLVAIWEQGLVERSMVRSKSGKSWSWKLKLSQTEQQQRAAIEIIK